MTIYDIAKEAGVAASTVSRVINHKPGIKAETRERVEALLKKYNYTPDANARGLVMQSSRTIGILIVDFRVSHHTEGAFFIERAMAERGYFCMTFTTGPAEENMDKYLQQLRQHRQHRQIRIKRQQPISLLLTELFVWISKSSMFS